MKKVFLVGNISNDATQSQVGDRNVVNINVAVNQRKRDEPADFFRLSIWNKQIGDFVMKYLKKGDKVAVTGDLRISTYVDRNNEKQLSLNVDVDSLESAGSRASATSDGGTPGPAGAGGDDDLPF